MAAISPARRGQPHPPLALLLAQLPNILGDDERRAASSVGRLVARLNSSTNGRAGAHAGAARRTTALVPAASQMPVHAR